MVEERERETWGRRVFGGDERERCGGGEFLVGEEREIRGKGDFLVVVERERRGGRRVVRREKPGGGGRPRWRRGEGVRPRTKGGGGDGVKVDGVKVDGVCGVCGVEERERREGVVCGGGERKKWRTGGKVRVAMGEVVKGRED